MKFDKDFEEPSDPPKSVLFDFIGTLIALAILTPIGWWLKEHHFIADWIRATFY